MTAEPVLLNPLSSRVPAEIAQTDPLVHVLERIVRDPSVPLERLQMALELSERMAAKRAKVAFDAAYAAMAEQLPIIDQKGAIDIGRGKPQRYARLEDIIETTKPILSEHGFGVRFQIAQTEKTVTATAVLSHCQGHSEETPVTLPHDVTGSKNVVQGIGSAISYAKRYALSAALNLGSRYSEDDDGDAAGKTNGPQSSDEFFVTPEQTAELERMVKLSGRPIERFCLKFNLEQIGQLPASKYNSAVNFLDQFIPKAKP
jgi:hypothetical protein